MSLNFIKAWRNDKYNKIDLIWRFTLVLIKKIMDKLGDQTGLFHREILKPLKWTNITSFFLIWLKRSTKIFISL
jgi:hypothetical protein